MAKIYVDNMIGRIMPNVEEIKIVLKPIFDKYKVKNAVLFGSVAKNTATDKSDVDIFVDSGLRGLSFYGLLEDVVEATGKDIDLIDKSQISKGSKIEEEINKTGIKIYG